MSETAVYPRTYGEHFKAGSKSNCPVGLSPYLRGTRMSDISFDLLLRFIPVLTGNTNPAS
ncbi:conserved hypothetical protein [Xenorhabdus nematophila str. Websteri]|nr:conserved hypothetical protein [Xenorhabdus nematophila str. Websteri]